MLLVFTFLCVTYQTITLTLDETLDFFINLVGEERTKSDVLDKTMKKDLTMSNLEEVNDHALAFGVDEDNCTQVRDAISLS